MFHHRFADLSGKVEFGSVHLKTSSMPISILGMTADDVRITSSDGLISGILNITSNVEVVTQNAPIFAIITMNNQDPTKDVKAVLQTLNSPVDAQLNLRTPSSQGGSFTVDARTLNAHVQLATAEQPLHSNVSLTARTMRAPVTIIMHPAFEGSFSLYSNVRSGALLTPHATQDPEGLGRSRRFRVARSTNGTSEGQVWWGDRHGGNCSVDASTTMFPVTLQ